MIQTSIANVISPAITTNDPYALFHQHIRQAKELPSFVGVALTPGTHEVEIRWEPGSLKTWLLAAGLLVLAALFVLEHRVPILRAATPGE